MAILDTFYILFKSDSSEAEKGLAKIRDLTRSVSAEFLKFATIGLTVHSVFESLKESLNYGFELSNSSKALGVNIEELNAWGNAVRTTGGNVDTFKSSLQKLSETLGVAPEIALRVLPKLAESFQKLGSYQAQRYGKMLGLDESTILLLQQGRREIDSLIQRQKELGVFTQKDTEIFTKFRIELANSKLVFQDAFSEILLLVLPALSKINHAFQDFAIYLRKHTGLIKGALIPITVIFGVLAAEFVIANAPMLVIIAAFGALSAVLALAYDDIQTFLRGGESLVGHILKKWPIITKVFNEVSSALSKLNKGFEKFIENNGLPKLEANQKIKFTFLDSQSPGHSFLSQNYNSTTLNTGSSLANKSNVVNIDSINISTNSGNPRDIAFGIGQELQKQLRQTQNDAATGVLI